MHGAKGGAKLLKRLNKILENLKAAHGGGSTGNTVVSSENAAAIVVASDQMMASGVAVGSASFVAVEGAATAWPLTAPATKRAKLA